jgi:hypothetical protein
MSRAFRIILALIAIIAMVTLPPLVEKWTFKAVIAIGWLEVLCACLLAAACTPPTVSAILWRVLAGLLWLTFVGYLVAELIASGGTFTTSKTSQHSVLSALLGLVFIGGPSLKYALRGNAANPDDSGPEHVDPDEPEESEK